MTTHKAMVTPGASPVPAKREAGVVLTPEQKEITLLRIIDGMGGRTDSSDYPGNWLTWFCSDEIHNLQEDTFNRCNDKGWLHTTHDTSFDTSTTTLTAAGRAALSTSSTPAGGEDAPAPVQHLQVNDAALLKAVMEAIVSCGHEIDRDSVVLKFSNKQGGHNAYSQLSARVQKALGAHHATVSKAEMEHAPDDATDSSGKPRLSLDHGDELVTGHPSGFGETRLTHEGNQPYPAAELDGEVGGLDHDHPPLSEDDSTDIAGDLLSKTAGPGIPAPSSHVTGKAEAFDRIVAARKTHIDAVNAYNVRLKIVRAERERGTWDLNTDHEYREMSETARAVDKLVRELCDAALATTEGSDNG